jgi:putative endonuclease
MHHVYLLRSLSDPTQTYIGLTDDVRQRLKGNNEGASFHTAKYRPWELVCCITFKSREQAAKFEKYLKAGSGHAFAKRHLW